MTMLKRTSTPILLFVILAATVAALLVINLKRCEGVFVYSLDDAYIHGAIAKHLAGNGVWGVTPYHFSSSSSSIVWPLVLAAVYFVAGPHVSVQFVINCLLAMSLVLLVYRLLRSKGVADIVLFPLLAMMIFATPLAPMIFNGMEHILQMLVVIVYAEAAVSYISGERQHGWRGLLYLSAAAFSVTLVRYEGLFIAFAVSLLLLFRGRIMAMFANGFAALVPVVVYGIVSLAHGCSFLPNSLLLKGVRPDVGSFTSLIDSLGYTSVKVISGYPPLLILIAGAYVLLWYHMKKGVWHRFNILLIIFIGSALLHCQFSRVSIFFRHEAYLFALGFFSLAEPSADVVRCRLSKREHPTMNAQITVLVLAGIILVFPFMKRAAKSHLQIPENCHAVYNQHFQMAAFLGQYYSNEPVVADDIGAVNFFADLRCLDLWGLDNYDIVSAKLDGRFNTTFMDAAVREGGCDIAVIHERYYDEFGGVPSGWILCGQWKTHKKTLIAGGNVLSFYAFDTTAAEKLRACLNDFSPHLPVDIERTVGGRLQSQ